MPSIFRVGLITRELRVIEVEAENSEEAVELAAQQLDPFLDYDIEFVEEA